MYLAAYLISLSVLTCIETVYPACVADIVFVLDRSGSTREYGYANEKKFVQRVAGALKIGPALSHAGLVSFADTAKIEIQCNAQTTTADFNSAVDKLLTGEEYTNIYDALVKTRSLFVSSCNRPAALKLVFLLTDGNHNVAGGDPFAVAADLRSRGVRLFVVGIGAFVNQAQLEKLAGSKAGVYNSKNFDELVTDAFVASILNVICTAPFPEEPTPPATTTKPTTRATPTRATTTTVPPPIIVCKSAPADVCLVLDSSGSVVHEWATTKIFAKDLSNAFKVSKDGIHVGIVTFATSAFVKLTLNECTSSQCVNQRIDSFGRSEGGFTNLDDALVKARDQVLFNEAAGARPAGKTPKHVILVTDGAASPFFKQDGSATANDIRSKGGEITVLAIGNDQRLPLLRKIADNPAHFKTARDFAQLLEPAFLSQFLKEVCEQVQG